MSSFADVRVERALELVARLNRTLADFAKKEEQLVRDVRARRQASDRKYRDAVGKTEAKVTSQTEDLESRFLAEDTRIRALYESRRARIQRAQSRGIRNLPKRAQDAKGRWMGTLQMKHFNAERTKTSQLEAAAAAAVGVTAKLADEKAALVALERRAQKSLRGYPAFLRLLRRERDLAQSNKTNLADQSRSFEALPARLAIVEEQLAVFREFLLPQIFSLVPLAALVAFALTGGVLLALVIGPSPGIAAVVGSGVIIVVAAVLALYRLGFRQSQSAAAAIAQKLGEAIQVHEYRAASWEQEREGKRQRIEEDYKLASAAIGKEWRRAGSVEREFTEHSREKIEVQLRRISQKIDGTAGPRLERLAAERTAQRQHFVGEAEARTRQITETHDAELAEIAGEEATLWTELEREWQHEITPIYHLAETMNAATAADFPPWDRRFIEGWVPPASFARLTKFGQLDVDLTKRAEVPKDARFTLPGAARLSVPLALTLPTQGSILFETKDSGGGAVIGTLNNIILRLLSTTPPGKISFTIIDPVGLGHNFSGLMHLADYEESLINRRIWTQRDQIEERLAELSDHIEKVIQMYLRNEYATITEYNEQAGSVAEKYHFLVVADFPANFSETAAKRLQSIAVSGPRCGIFTLIHWDQRQVPPDGFVADDLRKNSVCVRGDHGEFVLGKEPMETGTALVFDPPPAPELAVDLVHRIGRSSIDSNRVEVPFAQIAPAASDLWTNDTTTELRIAIGRTGATKHQYLAIGKGTRQHALFAGKTGSGKSTLFHVIITNLALACSPEQVEFYLIDFKKGVEFKGYATKRLPHARVIAIESDREFALSVLQRVDEELKRRGDLFRKLGVQDIPGYKKAGGTEPVPRSLLIIDEFQEFFVEDDSIAQTASLLFDRIVRQGRAFGIHVLLGSQSLGGAYSLARATIGQMVIRVALQCNEADAYLIMDDSNSAPRLLSRPGEGIYNDAGGAVEGNSPFQVVWLPDHERDSWLDQVRQRAEQAPVRYPSPIVFEGNAPADLRENDALEDVLNQTPVSSSGSTRAWLGAPNSIKGPTEALFHRQSGNNLLIIGQREEAALTLLGVSLLALAAQYPIGGVRFVVLHGAIGGSADAEFIQRIMQAVPHEVVEARNQEVADVMNSLSGDLKARSASDGGPDAPSVFLLIHGLQKFKKLRSEDDFDFSLSSDATVKPGAQLNELLSEGSSHGIHVLASVDTFNNMNRFINRKALTEFEMRVVFQMSANDSASLIDSPKASTLGLHRALFYNEQEGYLETFRPYATPDPQWIREAGEKLARRRG